MCLPVIAEANSNTVAVTVPKFPITINGQLMENVYNQYPLLLYKGTAYMPLTYDNCKFMGIKFGWYEESYLKNTSIYFIGRDIIASDNYKEYKTTSPDKKKFTASILPYGQVAVNTHDRSMYRDNTRETYPLLSFRNMLYFPLNWDYAVEQFGWEYSFDKQSGLKIDSTDPIKPVVDDSLVGGGSPGHYSTVEYVYDKAGYAGYPPFTLDNHFNFV